ncbi:MAG: pantetheine-phosphate adenylyltransferase [Clostridia bacterium]|nr:pantetheine-phosphate adenylyltransferase [Clostridia bacterium]
MEKKKCVFAGTFDPPTKGHETIIDNCLKLFDEVVVAVLINPDKTPYFTEKERISLLKTLFAGENRVKIRSFSGAAVDLLEEEKTPFYVRGIRNTVDFECENANFFANKKLKNDIVTVYLPAEQENLHISSSLVKNSIKFNKDFEEYIPEKIREEFYAVLEKKDV